MDKWRSDSCSTHDFTLENNFFEKSLKKNFGTTIDYVCPATRGFDKIDHSHKVVDFSAKGHWPLGQEKT
jgi:hypothetical protein